MKREEEIKKQNSLSFLPYHFSTPIIFSFFSLYFFLQRHRKSPSVGGWLHIYLFWGARTPSCHVKRGCQELMGQNAISNNGQLISRLTVCVWERGWEKQGERQRRKNTEGTRQRERIEQMMAGSGVELNKAKKRGMGNKGMRSGKWERETKKKKLKSIQVCLWIWGSVCFWRGHALSVRVFQSTLFSLPSIMAFQWGIKWVLPS